MSRWFRHYAGMMRDDKLVSVAIRSKQPIERVVWVWGAILESAAEIDDDGRFDVDPAEIAYFLRADEADIHNVIAGLETAGRVAAGAVVKWSDRQFQSDRSANRQAAYRERKRAKSVGSDDNETSGDAGVTSPSRHRDAPETETELDTDTNPDKSGVGKARKRAPRIVDLKIPDWMPSQAWADFCDMRRQSKSAFTVAAAKGIVADLVQFHAEGHDVEAILMKSVKRGYRGVFKPEGPPPPRGEQTDWTPERRQAHLAAIEQRGRTDPPPPPRERGRGGGARPIGKLIGHVGA